MLIKLIFTTCFILLLNSCSQNSINKKQEHTKSLQGLKSIYSTNTSKGDFESNKFKNDSLIDTAYTLSTQSGLAYRAIQINEILDKNSSSLDKTFNFRSMIIDDNVLSPILIEAHDSIQQSSNTSFRISDMVYKIDQQARFVTNLPSWRNYLNMIYNYPKMPNESLLPKNSDEAIIWQEATERGWANGIKQANSIFSEKLNTLKRDFSGMILYQKLLSQNIISKPFVSTASMGVTGNSLEVRVNDQIKKITSLPVLQTDSTQWNPVIEK